MKGPNCRVMCLGELTTWGKQFVGALHNANILDVANEPSIQKFSEAPAPAQPQILMIENFTESRHWITKLRQSGRRFYLIWFGKSFTKEDLAFALENRVYCVFENLVADDKRVTDWLQRLVGNLDNAQQFEQIMRSLKSILLQTETDGSKPLLQEIKSAVSKLEKKILSNELNCPHPQGPASSEGQLPFHQSQQFGDALTTVHDLERTGVLHVRGDLDGQEGKVEFLQGKIISCSSGEARGLKAIYRMFLWDEPRFLFHRRDPNECIFGEQGNFAIDFLCKEGEELKRRFEGIRAHLPPAQLKVELQPSALHPGTGLSPEDFDTLATVIEFGSISDILDYNNLPDVAIYEALIRLRKDNIIRVA